MEDHRNISVIDPISPAIDRVKFMLFKPFFPEKWFVIGFCAWLVILGSGGVNFNVRGPADFSEVNTNEVREFFLANLHWIIPVSVGLMVLGIAIRIVLMWLSSRAHFMFLYCVARNKAEVKNPWHLYRREGNSLFLFRLVVGIISTVFFLVLGVGIVFLALMLQRGHVGGQVGAIAGIVMLGFVLFAAGLAILVFYKLTFDFVVAIMYMRSRLCVEAWREYWALLRENAGKFALYILFQIVINMAIGAIIMIVGVLTCCCGCCAMSLPYIGTVVLLPLHAFKRSYSLYYLRQFGGEYDAFNIGEELEFLPE